MKFLDNLRASFTGMFIEIFKTLKAGKCFYINLL